MARFLPRNNPFRASRIEALAYRFEDGDLRRLLERFEGLGRRGALVGPKGHGKTTLLETLERHFAAAGQKVVRLRRRPEGPPLERLRGLGPEHLVSLDGAEQLGFWETRCFRRDTDPCGGVLVTAHRDLRWIPTLHTAKTSPELFRELVAELLGREQLRGPWSRDELEDVYRASGGNLRTAFRRLYDLAAETPREPGAESRGPEALT